MCRSHVPKRDARGGGGTKGARLGEGRLRFSGESHRESPSAWHWLWQKLAGGGTAWLPALGGPGEVDVTVAAIEADISIHLQIGIAAQRSGIDGPGVRDVAVILRNVGNRQSLRKNVHC